MRRLLLRAAAIAVTLFGVAACTQILGDFTEIPAETCAACEERVDASGGACEAQARDCQAEQDCTDYDDCTYPCHDDTCVGACANAHPTGAELYNALVGCECHSCGVCGC